MENIARGLAVLNFQDVLTRSLAALDSLRMDAAKALNSLDNEQPEYDAAYQVWKDLDKAHSEMTRTQMFVSDGAI